MRLWAMSDLHLDVRKTVAPFVLPDPRPACDVVVIAGDIREDMSKGIKWVAAQDFGVPVVVVGGNHEWYRNTRDKGLAKGLTEAAKHPNIHLLQDDFVDIGGVRFIGATLWTDYLLDGEGHREIAMLMAEQMMNDHRAIRLARADYRPWLPRDCAQEHQISAAYIKLQLSVGGFDGPRVVVTHHAPSYKSIDPRYVSSAINGAFASNLDHLVDKADLWLHGHVHHTKDYRIGDGRVVCNPRGYVGFGEQSGFDPVLTIDV